MVDQVRRCGFRSGIRHRSMLRVPIVTKVEVVVADKQMVTVGWQWVAELVQARG